MNLNGNIKNGKLGGRVIAATCWLKEEGLRNRRVILIRCAKEWVTAVHCEGDVEWLSGKYFVTLDAAWESFADRAKELLSHYA
jgi:hypothetical protein